MKISIITLLMILFISISHAGRWTTFPQGYGQQPSAPDPRLEESRRQTEQLGRIEREKAQEKMDAVQRYKAFLIEVKSLADLPVSHQFWYSYEHFGTSEMPYRKTFFSYWCKTNQSEIIKWIDNYETNVSYVITHIDKDFIFPPYHLSGKFKIADAAELGCRTYSDNWIWGFNGLSDRIYSDVLLKEDGIFRYKTTIGSTRVIPAFRVLDEKGKRECYFYGVRKVFNVIE